MEAFTSDTQGIGTAVRRVLAAIGEDPDRAGLVETPKRVAKMCGELFRGYDPQKMPKITTFSNGEDGIVYDSMVVDSGDFYSLCEHHMLPFFGRYWFAYVPNPYGRILGLSKIARVVDYCAARLQIQERLGRDIVQMLTEALGQDAAPLGMAIILRGEHLCKTMRGARKRGTMTTSYYTGIFRTDAALRAEFLKEVTV